MGTDQNKIAQKTDSFLVGSNGQPLVASNDYWSKRAVDRIDQCYDNLREARQFLQKGQQKIPSELEELFQMTGKAMIQLVREVKKYGK